MNETNTTAQNLTRFLILADTHDLQLTSNPTLPFRHPLPPNIDVVLHCGDLTQNGGLRHHKAALNMLGSLSAELKLVIPGNHEVDMDCTFLKANDADLEHRIQALEIWSGEEAKDMGVHFLDEGTHRFTLKSGVSFSVYASPYTPRYGDSAFQYPTGHDRYNPATSTPPYATNRSTDSSRIPEFPNVDIVMTHGPPKYILDSCGDRSGGCEHLRRAVARARPVLHCFGHVHAGWGHARVAWKRQMSREERRRQNDFLFEEEEGYNGYDEDEEDDALVLPKEFVGANSCKKQGFAKPKALHAERKGKETLIVNAAIGNDENSPVNAPWVVEISLPRTQVSGMKRELSEGHERSSKSNKTK
ncbi:MAG: hypothetical protein M1831_004858 [Alyxoria varia]|nr:MAG: hypothetical protein M1831_004858 [Alyxoria varia]